MLAVIAPAVADDLKLVDEPARIAILQALFPKRAIYMVPGKRIDHSSSMQLRDRQLHFPDALKDEPVYRITGPYLSKLERCASKNLSTGKFSQIRELRFQAFAWPGLKDEAVAVVQYKFIGANPAGSCWSIGKIVHLQREAERWSVVNTVLPEMQHHGGFGQIRLLDLSGDGVPELLVESDAGGGGSFGHYLHIFALENRGLERWLAGSLASYEQSLEREVTEELDVSRTVAEHGQRSCFTRTLYRTGDNFLRTPRVSHPCVERRSGPER